MAVNAIRDSKIVSLPTEIDQLRRDADKYRWLQRMAVRSHSLHMDGSSQWEVRFMLGRAKSFDEALEYLMEKNPLEK